MQTVHVNLGPRSYDIAMVSGDPAGLGQFAAELSRSRRAFLVTDQHVIEHAENVARSLQWVGFTTSLEALPSGEEQKALAVASEIYDRLVDVSADRKTLIVAVGGGVVGDLAGFVAATFNRGLPLFMVPTTLLSMVDSSVGGKVGINHPRAKNLIGAFHQPIGVWIDTAVLSTLPEREYRSGLAEVVKYGAVLDAELFVYLETNAAAILKRDPAVLRHMIARCCRIKADVVEQDEREETGLRAILNYGHTFGHAFEKAAGYGAMLHGEAVAAGMICASRLAELRGLIPAETTQRQRQLLETFGLPVKPERWKPEALLKTMQNDKKTLAGRLRFILPNRLGEAALFDDVPEEDIRRVLEEA